MLFLPGSTFNPFPSPLFGCLHCFKARAKMVVSKTPGPGQYEIPTTLIGSLAFLANHVFREFCNDCHAFLLGKTSP